MTLRRFNALAAATATIAGCLAAAPATASPVFFRHSCEEQLNAPKGARCGIVVVPESRAQAGGKTIGLNVLVLPASAGPKQTDAIVDIVGELGQPAVSTNGIDFAAITGSAHATRDLVLVDPRGTGGSRPLQCEIFPGSGAARFFAPDWPTDILEKCGARLGSIADLSQYSTDNEADDLDDVRAALGYDKFDLVGAAYGSTVALDYMRRHPGRVRTAVLEGVAGMNSRGPLPMAKASQRALDVLFADCAADTVCRGAVPNIRSEFATVLAKLAKGPVNASVTDPATKSKSAVQIDLPTFVSALPYGLYDTANASDFLGMIHAAALGNYDAPAAFIAGARGGLAGLYSGMAMSVACPEQVANIDPAVIPAAVRGTFLGDSEVQEQIAACDVWPTRSVDPSFFAPVRSNAPVLLLTGALDPLTPPDEAAAVQRYLPHAINVTFPHVAHTTKTQCGVKLVSAFIAAGDGRGLDTSCASQEQRPPFKF
ncbi:MAG TPA: alpha/beta fold hydrolase [Candidatus Eremiobacteraceae bacterium]|nr:alpha/beta fold hydrolase [Candidatus Eremiobacteraceae bacterium]